MTRPKVTLENHKRVYEWYRDNGQSTAFAKFGHYAVAMIHRPETTADAGAGHGISALLDTHARLILVANHIDARDVTVLPAVAGSYKPLRPIIGEARIVAKQEMFNGEFFGGSVNPAVKKVGGFAMRRVGDALGMIPAMRGSSNQNADKTVLVKAHQELAETVGYFLKRGVHIALFGEGTRNRDNPEIVQPIKSGLMHMIEEVDPAIKIAVVPIGIWYPEGEHVRTHIGSAFIAPGSMDDLTGEVQEKLQHCVDMARTIEVG